MRLMPYYLCLAIMTWNLVWTVEFTISQILSSHAEDMKEIKSYKSEGPLRIYTEDGVLIGEYGVVNREIVKLHDMPSHLINAILIQEDQDFWDHPGVNILSLGRAAKQLIENGKIVSGGSTITMQLVKNHVLSREKTFIRKLKEIIIALEIENLYTKKELLEAYINTIYLGERCFGVGAAAEHFFGKRASELTLAESIRLAITIKSPSLSHPNKHSSTIENQFHELADKMREAGTISKSDREALELPSTIDPKSNENQISSMNYIRDHIYQTLMNDFGESILSSGLDVRLTINSVHQKAAESALQWGLTTLERRSSYAATTPKNNKMVGNLIPVVVKSVNPFSLTVTSLIDGDVVTIFEEGLKWTLPGAAKDELLEPGDIAQFYKKGDKIYVHKDPYRGWMVGNIPKANGSATMINHHTGEIKAMVGGFDYNTSQFNRAVDAKRQVASTIKPFLYMLALEKGMNIDSEIDLKLENIGEDWSFIEKGVDKTIRLRDALIHSNNQAAVSVLAEIGISNFKDYLQRFGMDASNYEQTLALALGIYESNTLNMAHAYSLIANQGFNIKPYLIKEIKSRFAIEGASELSKCSECKKEQPSYREFSRASDIRNLLSDVVNYGTAKRAKLVKSNDIGGKTGTSNDAMDVWFSGFYEDITASVWVGGDKAFNLGEREYGSSVALPIWVEMMETLKSTKQKLP